jgi:hypothetical protein
LKGTKGSIEEVSTDGHCHQRGAQIGPNGFVEDRTRTSGIVMMNSYVMHCIDRWPGSKLQLLPGQLGDNILVGGMGNLSVIPIGTLIGIESKVILRVESKAAHYRQMFPHFPEEVLRLLDRRGGITCSVVKGVGKWVGDGDEVEILEVQELKGAA